MTTHKLTIVQHNKILSNVIDNNSGKGIVQHTKYPVEDTCRVFKDHGIVDGVLLFYRQQVINNKAYPLCYAYDLSTQQYLDIAEYE